MSEVAAEVARVRDALDGPRLRLINFKWAPIVLAVFRAAFGPQSKTVKAERLHAQVDAYLEELSSLGYEVPSATGRALCVEWMNFQWLKRVPAEGGGEAYELTSETLAAQRVLEGMSRERTLLSESRLTTILDTARRWAMEANPDRAYRIAAHGGGEGVRERSDDPQRRRAPGRVPPGSAHHRRPPLLRGADFPGAPRVPRHS